MRFLEGFPARFRSWSEWSERAMRTRRSTGSAVAMLLAVSVAVPMLAAGGVAPPVADAAWQQAPQELAGLWEMDPDESDDPAEVMARLRERQEERRRERRGRSRSGGRGAGFPGSRGGDVAGGRMGMGLGDLPEILEIEVGGREMRLVLEERVQIFYLDGEEHVRQGRLGGRIETVSEVRAGIVRVSARRETLGGASKTFRTFEAKGDLLVVRTEIELPRAGDPILVRTIYRRIPS